MTAAPRWLDWPQEWRSDRGLMERICPHGIGHPDPDVPLPDGERGIHGCDGCCRNDEPPQTTRSAGGLCRGPGGRDLEE